MRRDHRAGIIAGGGTNLTLPSSRPAMPLGQLHDFGCVPFVAWPLLLSRSGPVCRMGVVRWSARSSLRSWRSWDWQAVPRTGSTRSRRQMGPSGSCSFSCSPASSCISRSADSSHAYRVGHPGPETRSISHLAA